MDATETAMLPRLLPYAKQKDKKTTNSHILTRCNKILKTGVALYKKKIKFHNVILSLSHIVSTPPVRQ